MTAKTPDFRTAARLGFTFPGAREWIRPGSRQALAQDAAMITSPNAGVPVELTAYIDPMVVEIMTAPRRARAVFGEEKKGSWVSPYAKWRTEEIVGRTTPYSDYANGAASDINVNWLTREQYIFQTSIAYGDLELEMSSAAKIDLAAAKQRAAATAIDIDANRFYLLGVEGRDIYGILNDPNLPDAVTPESVGDSTAWAKKNTTQIYNDVLKLYGELAANSAGLIDMNTPLVLLISPAMNRYLGVATDFNVSVLDMLNKYFGSLRIETLPELTGEDGETLFLIAPEVAGQASGLLAFGEKMRAGRVISDMSSFRQKFAASTYGGIVLRPFAFAQMTGIEDDSE